MLKLLITDRLFKCQLRYVINNYILLANIGYLHFIAFNRNSLSLINSICLIYLYKIVFLTN